MWNVAAPSALLEGWKAPRFLICLCRVERNGIDRPGAVPAGTQYPRLRSTVWTGGFPCRTSVRFRSTVSITRS